LKTLILTENQIKKIIDDIVLEQNQTKTESTVVPLDVKWDMGKWKMTQNEINSITNKLVDITNFINRHKDSLVTIQIEASESRVTNYDREGGGKTKLESGVLSQRRGTSMVDFLKQYFQGLVNKGAISKMPEIPNPISKIGQTEYTGANDLNDKSKVEKYKNEQYVNAIISLKKDYDCIVGMEITIGYFPEQNSQKHQCDEAIFELKMNGVSIGEVNLNNGTMDTGLDKMRIRNKKNEEDYNKRLKKSLSDWDLLVKNGQSKDTERAKNKYIETNLGPKPEVVGLPNWITSKSEVLGYGEDYNRFTNDLDTINGSFKNYGRKSDGNVGGARSQTFSINGEIAQSIIKNAPSEKIVLSLTPLVSKNGKYKIFYAQGSHSDTPWVTIKSRKSEQPLFNGEPNINMKRGTTTETVLLQTDLCGNPIN
jgi:hypothetical protein